MKPQEKRVIYYSNTTDDFAGTNIKAQKIDETFRYVHSSLLWKVLSFLLYYIIALPLVWAYMKIVHGLKFANRAALRSVKGGVFLYGNHTHWSDSFLGHIAAAPKRTCIIASPDAVSIKGIRNIVQMLGCIPIPTEINGMRKFIEAVKKRGSDGGCVTIYPEAHIWPYYTGIRPFPATSFAYPADLHLPVVAMVTTYRERTDLLRFIRTPAHTVTFSEPFYAKPDMSAREAQKYLYRCVYDFMREHTAAPDNYEYLRYAQK